MTLLSDPGSKLITAFGIRDDQYGNTGPYSAIANPTIFILARDGTIVHRIPVIHSAPPPVDEVYTLLRSG